MLIMATNRIDKSGSQVKSSQVKSSQVYMDVTYRLDLTCEL